MVGRGVEPVLCYLEEMPDVARKLGEETLTLVAQTVWKISRSPNGKAIPVFLQTLAEASRRLAAASCCSAIVQSARNNGAYKQFHPRQPIGDHTQPKSGRAACACSRPVARTLSFEA